MLELVGSYLHDFYLASVPAPLARYFTKKNVMNIIIAGVYHHLKDFSLFYFVVCSLHVLCSLQPYNHLAQP